MVLSWSSGSVCKIVANITLESWLFGPVRDRDSLPYTPRSDYFILVHVQWPIGKLKLVQLICITGSFKPTYHRTWGRVGKRLNLEQGQNLNSQLSTAISAPILPIEPQDHAWAIHRNPVNGLMLITDLRVLWVDSEKKLHLKVGCSNFGLVRDASF